MGSHGEREPMLLGSHKSSITATMDTLFIFSCVNIDAPEDRDGMSYSKFVAV